MADEVQNNEIDSNTIADLKFKYGFIGEFISKMCQRMTLGTIKYGDTWKYIEIPTEIEQELIDVAVYAYLLWLKIRSIKKKVKTESVKK